MSDLPAPLVPAGADLRDFPHTPLFRSRLFGSSFHARATDAEWRAGVTLWLKSWDQVPAGSLPDDDVELCRLAELARDVKGWKRVKEGALRGWVTCSDGRLYHPVVAEGVNNAIDHKVKQRLKTSKARIAALEKHLKEAKTDDERARLTEEIKRVQQSLSQGLPQGLSQTLTLNPSEGKGEERGRGKGEGLDSSAPTGAGAAAPPDPPKPAAELTRVELWAAGKSLLAEQGMPTAQCGTFVGKLVKDFDDALVVEAVRITVVAQPADAASYLKATCLQLAGRRPKAGRLTEDETRAENERATAEAARQLGFATNPIEVIDHA